MLRIACPKPDYHISTLVSTHGDQLGDSAEYTCADGYSNIDGDESRVCCTGGVWSGLAPKCSQIGNEQYTVNSLIHNMTTNVTQNIKLTGYLPNNYNSHG